MSIKVTIFVAVLGLLALQVLAHRGGGSRGRDGDGDGFGGRFGQGHGRGPERRGPFEFERTENATCTARAVSQPATACSTCICFPDNVLNCWTLKARFCNPPSTTTSSTVDAGAA